MCFSDWLPVYYPRLVLARVTLPLRTWVHQWSALPRQLRIWECVQGWEITFTYFEFNATFIERELCCVDLESKNLKWRRSLGIFPVLPNCYDWRYGGFCWPILMASAAFSIDFRRVSPAQACVWVLFFLSSPLSYFKPHSSTSAVPHACSSSRRLIWLMAELGSFLLDTFTGTFICFPTTLQTSLRRIPSLYLCYSHYVQRIWGPPSRNMC